MEGERDGALDPNAGSGYWMLVDISPLTEITPDWILSNGMHKEGDNSRFRAIGEGRFRPHRLFAVSAAENGKVVSALIFEEYPDTSMFWGSFRKDGEVYLMNCRGRAGIYTLPDCRGRGLARAVTSKFFGEITSSPKNGAVNLIAHQYTIDALFRPLRDVRNWFPTPAPLGRNHWERQLKESFRFIPNPTPVTKDEAIATLLSKGWKVREESNGRLSLWDSGVDEEWGKVERTEFAGQVPKKFLGEKTGRPLGRPQSGRAGATKEPGASLGMLF